MVGLAFLLFITMSFQGPCHPANHIVMGDSRRWKEKGRGSLCDKNLSAGWYRFLLNNTNAVIPTKCWPEFHCSTIQSVWLYLERQYLPAAGQEIDAWACATTPSYCCGLFAPIKVRNCGHYFVYKVKPIQKCPSAFCVEPQA
ncbi:hypothetical protein ACOMHN_000766 [Nucella lapillus]